MPKNKIVVVLAGDNQLSQVLNQGTADVRKFGSEGAKVGTLLKQLGIAYVAKQLLEFGMQVVETADHLNELSQRTGIGTEALSAYQHGAKMAGVEQQALEVSLTRLNKTLSDAAAGSREAKESLAAVGVSAKDLKGNIIPTDEALAQIADRFARTPDGANKAALALQIFGRQGAALIPFLNQGRKGLEALKEECQRLGISLSSDVAKAADEFNDNLIRLRAAGEGLALQFFSGLLPAINQVAKAFDGQATEGIHAAAKAGEFLGRVVKYLVLAFHTLGTAVAIVWQKLEKYAYVVNELANMRVPDPAMWDYFAKGDELVTNELVKRIFDFERAIFETSAAPAKRKRPTDDLKRELADADEVRKQALRNRLDSERSAAELVKNLNEAALKQLEEAYSHHLVSIDEFYRRKRELQVESLTADREALQAEYALLEADEKRVKTEKDRLQVIGQMNKVMSALSANEIALNRAKGLTSGGAPNPEGDRIREMDIAVAKAAEVQRQIDLVYQELRVKTAEIFRLVRTRQITEIEGESQLNDARDLAVEKLGALADEYGRLAEASGDPQLKANHAQLISDIDDLSIHFNELRDTVLDAAENGLTNFFTDMVTGAKSAGEAFKSFAASVLGDIARMIAKMTAMWLLQKALGFVGGLFGNPTLGSSLFGKRAAGGPVSAGMPYLVGEAGPELIIPGSSGAVVPHHQLGGMGGMQVVYNIDARGASPGTAEHIRAALQATKEQAIEGAVVTMKQMGMRGYL